MTINDLHEASMVIIAQTQVINIVYGRYAYACHDAVGLSNSQFVFSPQSIDQEVLRSDCKAGFLIRVVAFGDKRLFHLSFDPRRRPKIDST